MIGTDTPTLRQLLAAATSGAASAEGEAPAHTSSVLLAGQVGAEVAAALSSALERVELLTSSGRIGRHSLRALHDEIARARRVAILAQQVSRLAAGRVRQAPEALELPQMLRDAVTQRADEIAARGIEVRQVLQMAPVSVDPSLLFSLLLSLIDWALEHGRAQILTLTTALNPWPQHAMLHCDFVWRAPDRLGPEAELAFEAERIERAGDLTDLDTMAWRLVEQACQAMGVRIDRQDSPCLVHLTLAFPEAPRRWTPLLDEAGATDASGSLAAQPLAGCRILVLATRADTRRLLGEVSSALGLSVEVAADLLGARALALAAPLDALIVDARDTEIDRLLAELKAGGSGPALLHVCSGFKGLEISTSGRFEILRLGVDTARQDLPLALRYALSPG